MSSKATLLKLKELCRDNNIKGYSKLKKNEIIELLEKSSINLRSNIIKD